MGAAEENQSSWVGENETEKSGIWDKMVMDEGFFEKVTSKQKPKGKGEPLRCPPGGRAWAEEPVLGKVSRPGGAS